jgi:DNA repair exonuclease SbcCD ATPase subunit
VSDDNGQERIASWDTVLSHLNDLAADVQHFRLIQTQLQEHESHLAALAEEHTTALSAVREGVQQLRGACTDANEAHRIAQEAGDTATSSAAEIAAALEGLDDSITDRVKPLIEPVMNQAYNAAYQLEEARKGAEAAQAEARQSAAQVAKQLAEFSGQLDTYAQAFEKKLSDQYDWQAVRLKELFQERQEELARQLRDFAEQTNRRLAVLEEPKGLAGIFKKR